MTLSEELRKAHHDTVGCLGQPRSLYLDAAEAIDKLTITLEMVRAEAEREVRRAMIAEERERVREQQVYLVDPFPILRDVRATEAGDQPLPLPVTNQLAGLLDKVAQLRGDKERLLKLISSVRSYMIPGMNWTDEIGQILKDTVDEELKKL